MQVPKFVPKSKKIETDEKKKKEEVESTGPVEEDINDVRLHLLSFFKANPNPFKLKNIEFEKVYILHIFLLMYQYLYYLLFEIDKNLFLLYLYMFDFL